MAKTNIFALGASFRNLTLKLSLVDLAGNVLDSDQKPIPKNHSSAWAPVLMEKMQAMLSRSLKPGHVLTGMGFSTGGIYDPEKGVFLSLSSGKTPALLNDEKNLSVASLVKPAFPELNVASDDFPNAMAMGEMWFGCAAGLSDFLYLQIEKPRATIVTNRAISRGPRLYAGEVAAWRFGVETIDQALRRSGYSSDVLADFFLNLILSYSPQKIILSLENMPKTVNVDLESVQRKLTERFRETNLFGMEPSPVEPGLLNGGDSARAAAALMFDEYFNSFTLS